MVSQYEQRRSQIENALETLSRELFGAKLGYEIASALHRAYNTNRVTALHYLLSATYHISVAECILSLTKVAIQHRKSITVYALFRYANEDPALFPHITAEDLQRSVTQHKKHLEEYAPLVEDLKTQRDKMLAHLSREVFTDQSKLESMPVVNMVEVGKLLQELIGIVNAFKGYFDDSELYQSLEYVERFVQYDADSLLALLPQTPTVYDPSLLLAKKEGEES